MTDPKSWLSNGTERSRRQFLSTSAAVGTGLVAGCLGGGGETEDTAGSSTEVMTVSDTDTATGSDDEMGAADWLTTELQTVRGGETFTIESLEAPVAIQSFAVWCPKCERQSKQLAGLDSAITRVGLNTDPNEDESKVRQHAEDKGFDWQFAVAPTEMTESLIAEFGSAVANAPSTPVIIACGDGTTTFKSGSVNAASEIEAAADEC